MATANTVKTAKDIEKVPFKKNQVKLAVNALLAHHEKESVQKKSELFEANNYLWLVYGLRKIPKTEIKPRLVPLPNPLHKSCEVCFISSQPGKIMKKLFEEKGIENIQKVISLTKLRKEFKTYELKRQLISSFDVFLCEEKIYHLVMRSLGKTCFKRKKEALPVRMRNQDLKKQVDKCIASTLLRLGHGACSAVAVGEISQHTPKELFENLIHAMRIVGHKMPGGWENIKTIHLKTSNSIALPVYQASPLVSNDLPDVPNDVAAKKRKRRRKVEKTLKNTNPDDEADNETKDDNKVSENPVTESSADVQDESNEKDEIPDDDEEKDENPQTPTAEEEPAPKKKKTKVKEVSKKKTKITAKEPKSEKKGKKKKSVTKKK